MIKRWTALAVAAAMLAGACSGGGSDDEPAGPSTTGADGATNTPVADPGSGSGSGSGSTSPGSGTASSSSDAPSVAGFRLSEGSPVEATSADPVTLAEGTALTPEQVRAVLDRLPAWDVPTDDELDFNVPTESLGPPLVSDTIDTAFPPAPDAPSAPDAVADGPLEVLRFQPEGEVDVAPFLSLTFNEPMVPLATLDQLDALDVPVTMTPEVDGRWRWIGTRTLRFEVVPDEETGIDRLPAATDFTVTVPAGTTSANGAELADEFSYSFATPPPDVTGFSGFSESMVLDPVFVVTFDQRVDPEAILAVTRFASGDVDGVRLATDEEIEADEVARRRMEDALPDRAVAFVPVAELSPDTPVELTIGPDIPSLEGPRTGGTRSESGRTYPPLAVVESDCGFGDDDCRPLQQFRIEFTNRLDIEAFDPTWIRVEPAVPGLRADVSGDTLYVGGATSGNTTYTVSVDGAIVDVFGQTLGSPYEAEFDVGQARPFLTGPNRNFVTTDPFVDTPGLSYTSVNHDRLSVTAWQLAPDQIDEYLLYVEEYFFDAEVEDPDWPVVLDTEVDVDGDDDQIVETTVDLTEAFAESGGPIVVRVQPDPALDPRDDDYWQNRPIFTWVQTTTLGVDAFIGDRELLVWTTDLQTGDPVPGATVELLGRGDTVTTDADGLARVELDRRNVTGVVATDGERSAVLPSSWFEGWTESERSNFARWYVIDDRGLYRPGETVRMAGFIREFEAEDAQLALFSGDLSVAYQAYDPVGNELGSGTVPVNALGGFNLSVDIPEESNTGSGYVELQLLGTSADAFTTSGHEFQVQDFRTPEFEVTARTESPAPYFLGEPATVAVDAEYFAGGPLPDAEVAWLVSTSDTTYRPPNRDDFEFGIWTPWWYSSYGGFDEPDVYYEEEYYYDEECFDCFVDTPRFQEFAGRTDAGGSHYLQIDFDRTDADGEIIDQPTSVTAESTVFDVNRQAFADRTNVLVHPADYYVGLRSDRAFVRQGEPLEIDAIVVDVDGNTVPGRAVTVTAGRLEYGYVDGRWTEELVDVQTCEITSDDADAGVRCEFATELGGQYEITAVVEDDDDRRNRAQYTQWVSGSTAPPSRNLEQAEVTIVPDAEEYAPGDTAELLIQAPFAPATGLVTVTRAGIESTEVVDAPDGSAVIEIPIADDDIPNLQVRVDMVGSDERVADDGTPLPDAPRRPAFAVGAIGLSIPPVSRTLDVVATPAAEALEPGAETSVEVAVANADGAPVADAGVVLIVVDEAVLSLTGYELLDPIGAFYGSVGSSLSPELIRNSIILANPDLLDLGIDQVTSDVEADDAMEDGDMVEESMEFEAADEAAAEVPASLEPADTAGGEGAAEPGAPIDVRSDFDALAVFAPEEVTGADGTVSVDIDLPDNLTRYRVMAVAVDGADEFGSGESTITARLPVAVRPSAPRFLNFGDRFELPVVVQNQTDGDLEVDVAIEVANLGLDDAAAAEAFPSAGQRVTIPANDRVEVRFPASAEEVGTARFRVAVASGDFADAAEVELPVYTPATSEAFATYGVLDGQDPIAQPVLAPTEVFPQFGGLEISTSSTALSALTDAVLYLYDYRYDSADGYAARIMAVAALRDVLDAFDAAGLPDADELDARVADDIERMQALQNGDGGFPYFQRGRDSIPWISVTVTHAQVLAVQNGYEVDENVLDFSLQHVRDIESYIPPEYSQSTRDAISAYALYVRDLAGDSDPGKALDLYRTSDTLQMDSLARLWPVLTDDEAREEILREIENNAVETPSAATFATSYGEDAYLIANSDRRTDGIVLQSLVTEVPDNDLIPKVVTGLLGNQNRGRWRNVYENVHILLALNEYFDTFESLDPDFVARAWLGETYALEEEFVGRSTDTLLTTVPMADFIASGDSSLILDKDGEGRLYYRLGVNYAPDDLDLDPRDEGFVVERVYESVDDPDDVVRNDDGTWTIRAGASVRVRLTMVADARRTHVALVDPIPAGLEAVNPTFATSVTVPLSDPSAQSGYWWWRWYEYQNLRDDRSEAFTSYLPGGTYEYSYVARATTPGEFVVPPTKAEEIYAPEVFGRSASDRVIVIDG